MSRYLIPSDATIKAVRSGDPRKRLSDGDGLYLLLFVKGGAHGWRLDYSFQGRRKTLSLGTVRRQSGWPVKRHSSWPVGRG